jgi:hypothetical protein
MNSEETGKKITKRNGSLVDFSEEKLRKRINNLLEGLET